MKDDMTDDERPIVRPFPGPYDSPVCSCSEIPRVPAAADTDGVSGQPGDSPENEKGETWQQTKQRLLADFSQWLDQLDSPPAEAPEEECDDRDLPDLFSFYGELAALRRDAQLQAKTVQSLRDEISELGEDLRNQAKEQARTVTDTVADLRAELPRMRRQAQADTVALLIELTEGLARCSQQYEDARLPRMLLSKTRRRRLADEWFKPVRLLAAKARDSLGRLGVRPTVSVGDAFDAGMMRAVEVVSEGEVPSGHVQEILRQGYTLQGDVLQTAEVKVMK